MVVISSEVALSRSRKFGVDNLDIGLHHLYGQQRRQSPDQGSWLETPLPRDPQLWNYYHWLLGPWQDFVQKTQHCGERWVAYRPG